MWHMLPAGRLTQSGNGRRQGCFSRCTPMRSGEASVVRVAVWWVYSARAGHELVVRSLASGAGSAQLDPPDGPAPSQALNHV